MSDKTDNTEALLQQMEALIEKNAAATELQQDLAKHINELINTDFEKLVQLLYRMDIDETKLKKTLHEHSNRNAGEMIAILMIERQLQKIKSRGQYRTRDNDIDENEKW